MENGSGPPSGMLRVIFFSGIPLTIKNTESAIIRSLPLAEMKYSWSGWNPWFAVSTSHVQVLTPQVPGITGIVSVNPSQQGVTYPSQYADDLGQGMNSPEYTCAWIISPAGRFVVPLNVMISPM